MQAQGDALVRCATKRAGNRLRQRRAYLQGAQPVGVGFDHGRAVGRADLAAQQAPVVAEGGEVDGEQRPGAVG
jgi:hypothetical protein